MANPAAPDVFWYDKAQRADVHEALWPYAQFLIKDNGPHYQDMLRNVRLYSGRNLSGLTPYSYFRTLDRMPAQTSAVNIVQSVVDTVVSRVAGTSRPAVTFITSNGDWSTQRLARKLTRWLDGLFESLHVHELGPQLVRDACICGDAYLYPYAESGKVMLERVHPFDIFYDLAESARGNPRQMFRRMVITRDRLMAMYPGKRAIIKSANAFTAADAVSSSSEWSDDLIECIEAIRLPSGIDSDDGKRAVVIEKGTLEYRKYERKSFPYIKYSYNRPFIGPYGDAVATQLQRSQVMINRLLKLIDTSLVSLAAPKIWMPPGTNQNSDAYVREPGAVLRSTVAPQILSQQVIPPEVYNYLNQVIERAYQMVGVSQQSAAAQKQPGITSGVAINAVDDIQSDRLAVPSLDYEAFYVHLAKACISVAKEIVEDEGHYKVQVKAKGSAFEEIDWAELDPDDDSYTLEIDPINGITNSLPGKLQAVANLQALGVIAPYQVPRLLRNPDLDAFLDDQSGMQDLIYKRIDRILDDGYYEAPGPLDDLQQSLALFVQAYAKAQYDGAPDDRLKLMRDYMVALKQKMAPPPQSLQMGTGAPVVQLPGPSQAPQAPQAATLQAV